MTQHGDEAAAGIIAFVVAGALFMGVTALVLLQAVRSIPPVQASDADPMGQARADAVLRVLLTPGSQGAGTGWNAGAWDGGSTGLPGLAADGGRAIDGVKLAAWQAGGMGAASDGKVNYDELRAALGLAAQGLDVHVRAVPVVPPFAPNRFDLDVAYVDGGSPSEKAALDMTLVTASSLATPGNLAMDLGITGSPATCTKEVLVYGTGYGGGAIALDSTHLDQFVRECGGTLIMMGSGSPCDPCLSSLWASALVDRSGNPLREPDPGNAALTVPNALTPAAWSMAGTDWAAVPEDAFAHPAPGWRVSDSGAFGLGRVLLIQHDGGALFATATATDGARLFENLLLQHDHRDVVDFGPAIPNGIDATPAVAYLPGPPTLVGGDPVPLRVTVHVWPRIA